MKKLTFAISLSFILILTACGDSGGNNNANNTETAQAEPVEHFEAVNQDEESVTLDDLEGKWWVADFVFTNCVTTCLPMTSNMKVLQDGLQEAGLQEVQLVTFSIDPENDTPEVLTEYGEQYGADFSNWHFLTGYEFDYIRDYSISSFKNLVAAAPEGEDQITHGIHFFLVNPEGVIVSHYSGVETPAMDDIIADLENSL